MSRTSLHDPGSWERITPNELRELAAQASQAQLMAFFEWAKLHWIVEPGRVPEAIRLRNPDLPAMQIALMPGLTLRKGPLGRSSIPSMRQNVLFAAAERASLWDIYAGTREETADAIKWAIDAGWVVLAAEHGRFGKRTGEWAELSREEAADALDDDDNWSAGPYPTDSDFSEVFVLLTASGQDAVATGVADDGIREAFAPKSVE